MADLQQLTQRLRSLDQTLDEQSWPVEIIGVLSEAGCWGNVIAAEHGGAGCSPINQLRTYEAVASGSLTAALILTQHDAACELLRHCDNEPLERELLPRCARGDALCTVGISQLTTSRRTVGPAMRAQKESDGFSLTGVMPWVTSALKADYVVTGAVLPDDWQILACIATDLPGLSVQPPMEFVALGASQTCEIRCDNVPVSKARMVRGPVARALARRSPVKSLSVSAVGIGLAGRLMHGIRERAGALADATELIESRIEAAYSTMRGRLFDAADALGDPAGEVPAMEIRVAANALLSRLSATYLTLSKGSGYLTSHPSQRLAREAMFFLVWSAPPRVQVGTLEDIWS